MTGGSDRIDRDLLIGEFRSEARSQLDELDRRLAELEEAGSLAPDDRQALLRSLHTLKGNAAMIGYDVIAGRVHALEELFKGPGNGTPGDLDPVFALSAALREAIERLGGPDEKDALESVATLDLAAASRAAGGQGRSRPPSIGAAEGVERRRTEARQPSSGADIVRVPFHKLDRLLTDVGELITAHARLDRFLEVNRVALVAAGVHRALAEGVDELERRAAALRDATMDLRLVPLQSLFGPFPAVARELAKDQGKRVRVTTDGADITADKAAIDALRDPLMHLVRNAIDHGVETPETRERKGKDPIGTIALSGARSGDQIVIEVADDGAGLDRAQILRQARRRGLVEESGEPDEDAIRRLILSAGFSTRDEATTVSGRGVGLDIVRRGLTRLRGSLDVRDSPGGGTAFVLRLPLTLAIIPVLVFEASTEILAVAVTDVSQALTGAAIETAGAREVVREGRSIVPVAWPHRVFGWPQPPVRTRAEARYAIVVRRGGRGAAIPVERLIDQRSVVVRSIPGYLGPVPGISGATVGPEGRVILLIDTDAFIEINAHSRGNRS